MNHSRLELLLVAELSGTEQEGQKLCGGGTSRARHVASQNKFQMGSQEGLAVAVQVWASEECTIVVKAAYPMLNYHLKPNSNLEPEPEPDPSLQPKPNPHSR